MKSIELNTAAVDNGGRRREAGETLTVGTKADHIDVDRAKDLVERAGASAIKSPPAPAASSPAGPAADGDSSR